MTSPAKRPHIVILFVIVSLLVVPVASIAIALGLGLLPLSYELYLVRQKLPVIFPLHMVASGLALILIPIAAATRRIRPVHRVAGRLAAAAVIAGGVTALCVSLASEAAPIARAGFFVQSLVWLALLAHAIAAIRQGDAARHARAMAGVAAVASGAIWLRFIVAAAIAAGLPFDTIYGVAAWACWLVPLAIVFARGRAREQWTLRMASL